MWGGGGGGGGGGRAEGTSHRYHLECALDACSEVAEVVAVFGIDTHPHPSCSLTRMPVSRRGLRNRPAVWRGDILLRPGQRSGGALGPRGDTDGHRGVPASTGALSVLESRQMMTREWSPATLGTAGNSVGYKRGPSPPICQPTLLRSPFRFETQPRVTWTAVGPGAVGPRHPRCQAQAQRRPVHGDGMRPWPAPSGRGTCPCCQPNPPLKHPWRPMPPPSTWCSPGWKGLGVGFL